MADPGFQWIPKQKIVARCFAGSSGVAFHTMLTKFTNLNLRDLFENDLVYKNFAWLFKKSPFLNSNSNGMKLNNDVDPSKNINNLSISM